MMTHDDSPFRNDKRDFALRNAMERIKVRNAYLATNNTDVSQWRRKTGGPPAFHDVDITSGSVIALLAPIYTCPWTLKRTNYVSQSNFDGGKWTCGVEEMKNKCIVYSFGSNNDDFFERDILVTQPAMQSAHFRPHEWQSASILEGSISLSSAWIMCWECYEFHNQRQILSM